jgi:hypothetical protein
MESATKKTAGSFIILMAFLIATLFIPARFVGVRQNNNHTPLVLRSEEELRSLSGDKNNNNIPDWQDLLVETMSTTTKEESANTVTSDLAKKQLEDPNNLTSSLSKNIYTAQALAKKNGTMTKEEQDSLVNNIVQEEAKKIEVHTYEVGDVTVLKTEDDTARRKYGNSLGLLMREADTYKLGSDDLAVIQAYNTSQDISLLTSLTIKKNNLDQIISDTLKVPVPSSAIPYHLLVLNRLSMYKSILESLSKADTDPVRATLAFNSYQETVQGVYSSLASMKQYFEMENITFLKNEPGIVFNVSYTK